MSARPAVFLGLGSNLGDREAALESAVLRLRAGGFHATERSGLYETEPVGGPPQGPYLNAVLRGRTRLGPEALLELCLSVERGLGRVRGLANGPRTLDIDLLLYGDETRATSALTVPHPRLHQRRFVLVPLAEIDPDVRHPCLGLSAAELLARCPDASRVARFEPAGVRR